MSDSRSSAKSRRRSERDSSICFALPGGLAAHDAKDLMACPFCSLAKSRRIVPSDFRTGTVTIRVEAMPEHGMATTCDADVLIWGPS
jgi:plasmid replication initiation protein